MVDCRLNQVPSSCSSLWLGILRSDSSPSVWLLSNSLMRTCSKDVRINK